MKILKQGSLKHSRRRFLGKCCNVLQTLMFLICRLPSSCRDMRGSFPRRLTPSFSQLTEGMGSPDAWHLSRATLSAPSVWLDGPWRMIGGGLSVSTAGQSNENRAGKLVHVTQGRAITRFGVNEVSKGAGLVTATPSRGRSFIYLFDFSLYISPNSLRKPTIRLHNRPETTKKKKTEEK